MLTRSSDASVPRNDYIIRTIIRAQADRTKRKTPFGCGDYIITIALRSPSPHRFTLYLLHLPTFPPLMSLRRSERLATATEESAQPASTRRSKRIEHQPSGADGAMSTSPAPPPSRTRSRGKRPRADVKGSGDGDQEVKANDDEGAMDPAKVVFPVAKLINAALVGAWRVNRGHKMCFIFDAISPARRFKRGMVYDEEADFPEDTCDGDITETDGPDPGWMPVDPALCWCVWNYPTPVVELTPHGTQDEIQIQMLNHSLNLHGLGIFHCSGD